MPRLLHPREKIHLDSRLGGPQDRPGRRGEENILDPTAIPTALSRLQSLIQETHKITEKSVGCSRDNKTPAFVELFVKEKLVT
jgi:hypothetical protein